MAEARRLDRKLVLRGAAIALFLAAIAVLVIQAIVYVGIIGGLGEWQFAEVGGYFPLLTLGLVLILFGVPALLLFKRRAHADEPGSDAALASAQRFFYLVLAGCILTAGMAAQRLWMGYAQVYTNGTPEPLNARVSPSPTFQRGMVQLTGRVHYNRQAEVGARTWFVKERARFVPVTAGADARNVTYFLETTQRGLGAQDGTVTGLLVRDALRPDAVKMLRDNGYRVATPHYVLFTNSYTLLRPYQMEALKWAVFALLLGLLAFYQRWRIRHMPPKRKGSAHFSR